MGHVMRQNRVSGEHRENYVGERRGRKTKTR